MHFNVLQNRKLNLKRSCNRTFANRFNFNKGLQYCANSISCLTCAISTLCSGRPSTACRMATLALRRALSCSLKGSLPSHISSLTSRRHRLLHKGKPPLPPAEALMASPMQRSGFPCLRAHGPFLHLLMILCPLSVPLSQRNLGSMPF